MKFIKLIWWNKEFMSLDSAILLEQFSYKPW